MGPIPHSKEHIFVKIKFECRPVLMSKHHDSLLFYGTLQIGIGQTLCSFEHVSCLMSFYDCVLSHIVMSAVLVFVSGH